MKKSMSLMDFSHKCSKCGECCRTQRIPFNILDIFDASAHLSMKPLEFVDRYLEIGTDNDGEMIFLVKEKVCPFLEKNQCSINEFKPTTCRTTPCQKNKEYAEFTKKYGSMTLQFLFNSPQDMIKHFMSTECTGEYLAAHKKFREKAALKYKEKIELELQDRKHMILLLERIAMIAVHPEFRDILTAKIRKYNA